MSGTTPMAQLQFLKIWWPQAWTQFYGGCLRFADRPNNELCKIFRNTGWQWSRQQCAALTDIMWADARSPLRLNDSFSNKHYIFLNKWSFSLDDTTKFSFSQDEKSSYLRSFESTGREFNKFYNLLDKNSKDQWARSNLQSRHFL